MLLEEADRALFKEWIVPKLETRSDAAADVLADYVIALITAEETEEAVKQNFVESLSDFLQDPKPFVEEVLDAVKGKSFLPSVKAKAKAPQFKPIPVAPIAPTPATTTQPPFAPNSTAQSSSASAPAPNLSRPHELNAKAPSFNPPTGPAAGLKTNAHLPDRPTGPSPSIQAHILGLGNSGQNVKGSLKRKLNDRESSRPLDGQDSHHGRNAGGERPLKQTARRRDAQRPHDPRGFMTPGAMPMFPTNVMAPMANGAAMPIPPAGFPAFNPADPMGFLGLLGGLQLPGMPPMPFPGPPLGIGLPGTNGRMYLPTRKERCKDYDTKGFCVLGSVCPYEHGEEAVLSKPLDEYDPNNASLAVQPTNGQRPSIQDRILKKSKSTSKPSGGRDRAPFSRAGPTSDHTNVTIVVEQIPKENFSEDDVRGFFSQFGQIEKVDLQRYKRLAIVKYTDHSAARRAYDSPKVIFENRFVKVYWYNPDYLTVSPVNGRNDVAKNGSLLDEDEAYKQDEVLNLAEIEKRQAAAQAAFEERRRKGQEFLAQIEDIRAQVKAKEREIREMRKRIAAKDGVELPDESDTQLMDELKELQAEALNLGINSQLDPFASGGRRRGGYRSRNSSSFPARGRGSAPSRGAYRGRGRGFSAAPGRTSVKRLDNRPKRLAISGIVAGSPKDEALRQHLTKGYEIDDISPHPDEGNALVVAFKERYVAEKFLDESLNIPDVGKLELSWVPNDGYPSSTTHQQTADGDVKMDDVLDSTETNDGDDAKPIVNGDHANGDDDYDVAGEDEWL